MARWSTVWNLPPEVLEELEEAIRQRAGTDMLCQIAAASGHEIHRSTMGRWAKGRREYFNLIEREREIMGLTQGIEQEIDDVRDKRNRVLMHMARNIVSQTMASAGGANKNPDLGTARELMKMLKDFVVSDKIDSDREAAIRREEREKTRAEAASAAENAGREAGASFETIELIKSRILGIGKR